MRKSGSVNWRPMSRFHFLSNEEIQECISAQTDVERSIVLDETARLAVIEVPSASIYHNSESILELRRLLWSHTIKTVLYEFRSDWFIYIFLDQPLLQGQLNTFLSKLLQAMHYSLDSTNLKVHSSSRGSESLALPLQKGFAWLDEQCRPLIHRDSITCLDSLQNFFEDFENAVNQSEHLHSYISSWLLQIDNCLLSDATVDSGASNGNTIVSLNSSPSLDFFHEASEAIIKLKLAFCKPADRTDSFKPLDELAVPVPYCTGTSEAFQPPCENVLNNPGQLVVLDSSPAVHSESLVPDELKPNEQELSPIVFSSAAQNPRPFQMALLPCEPKHCSIKSEKADLPFDSTNGTCLDTQSSSLNLETKLALSLDPHMVERANSISPPNFQENEQVSASKDVSPLENATGKTKQLSLSLFEPADRAPPIAE